MRLRIGILSSFLYTHTIGSLYCGLIERLDRKRFELVLIRTHHAKSDALSQRLEGVAHAAVRLPSDFVASQQALAALGLDVLFFPEIGMDARTLFLAFGRYARVQATSWGHPVTTGVANVDYFVSSGRLEVPAAQDHYSERLVRFADLPSFFHRPSAPKRIERKALGLAADARLYVCPQSLFKIHPDFDATLAQILRTDPKGVVVLVEGAHPTWARLLGARFERSMPDVCARVKFVPRLGTREFLGLLTLADVLLDSTHFGGGKTTYEALALGIPIVTYPSPYMRARVTAGAYDQIGFTGLIATSAHDYAERAMRVANDPAFRAECVAAIRDGEDRLFETAGTIGEFERFFERAYETGVAS